MKKYLIVGIDASGKEHRVGGFGKPNDACAWSAFWLDYASNLRYPDYDLILYRIGFFGGRTFITADY